MRRRTFLGFFPRRSQETMSEPAITMNEDRFSRFRAIEWWDQRRLSDARILVVGAGALGNEVVKNLALLGVGHLAVVDMDRVELSNLTRSVLFREHDAGRPKAECAVEAARAIYPEIDATAITGNILARLGLGWIHGADLVIGALDNREARVFVNAACARVGRPWIDGGIEIFQGVVRVFHAPRVACYECTMNQTDWDLLNKRRSCSFLARRALAAGGTPTTPSIASIIAGLQTMEAVKLLHGMEGLVGRGYFFDGLGYNSYVTRYPINPACPWHDAPETPVESPAGFSSATPLRALVEWAAHRLGGLDALDLGREIVETLECHDCGHREPVFKPLETLDERLVLCPSCRVERTPAFLHSVGPDSPHLDKTPAALGLPSWDILWPRFGDRTLGIVLAGDAPLDWRRESSA